MSGAYAKHEAQERPALERTEHATGQELSKMRRPTGAKEPGSKKLTRRAPVQRSMTSR
jgi:hypothetical protein